MSVRAFSASTTLGEVAYLSGQVGMGDRTATGSMTRGRQGLALGRDGP